MIDKLAKKFFIALAAVLAITLTYQALTDNTPSSVSAAKTLLSLEYHDKIYGWDSKCDIKQIKTAWVIFCHPDGKTFGGLFEIEGDENNYNIYPLNGKGETHANKIGFENLLNKVVIRPAETVQPYEAMDAFKEDITKK